MSYNYDEYLAIARREARDWLDTLSTDELVIAYNKYMDRTLRDDCLLTYVDDGNNEYVFWKSFDDHKLILIEDVTDYEYLCNNTEDYQHWLEDIAAFPSVYNKWE